MALDPSPGVPPVDGARPAETAAVAAAIERYLQAERREAADGAGRRRPGAAWGFAGRVDAPVSCVRRVLPDAPDNPWTAAGRIDRL